MRPMRFSEFIRKSRTLRRLVRGYRSRTSAYPRWSKLLGVDGGELRLRTATRAPRRVLIATTLGGYWAGVTLESALALALRMRGAAPEVLLCDGALAACQLCEIRAFENAADFSAHGPQPTLCQNCHRGGAALYRGIDVPIQRVSELVRAHERAECAALASGLEFDAIAAFERDELRIGEHALAGALRFFARGTLAGEPHGESVLRRFFHASLVMSCAMRRLFAARRYDAAVFHHGIYVPQGIVGEVARASNVRVVNWTPSYRRGTFIFSHGDSYHHTLLTEPTASWERMPWSDEEAAELAAYLKSRWAGSQDWIWFHNKPQESPPELARAIGADDGRPVIALLTNVIWDAQLHYAANAFASMMDWLLETVEYFRSRSNLRLVIRVHPAEIRGTLPSRERVADELARRAPPLSENVTLIGPDHELSTYALIAHANATLIYGTKTGVEVAATGKPVIVAGEAWVRGKGFTLDAANRAEYRALLDRLPLASLDAVQLERARRYAYHIFFRRMIPLEFFAPTGSDPPFRFTSTKGWRALEPGASAGLDVICAGILDGAPFIYPAERLGWPRAAT
ncbi:MAG: capsule biosynthesis protein [Planctomycetota bacterium]